jgi:hypothetical protein
MGPDLYGHDEFSEEEETATSVILLCTCAHTAICVSLLLYVKINFAHTCRFPDTCVGRSACVC